MIAISQANAKLVLNQYSKEDFIDIVQTWSCTNRGNW